MSKKMTSLEWFFQRLIDSGIYLMSEELEFYEQAKQMEKGQIENAYLDGFVERQFSIDCKAEQYYNETFKSE